MIRTIVFTSDTQQWCLRPYALLQKKYYASADITIVGFTPPPFTIPYPFHSVGPQSEYPYSKWSNAVIAYLNTVLEPYFVFMLEDYWLIRQVDVEAIEMIGEFMQKNPGVSKVDLTCDRLYAPDPFDVGAWGRLDLIQNPLVVPYTHSLMPAVWRTSELLRYLMSNENPHEAEINGTRRMIDCNAIVLGTRQLPMRILVAVQQGKLTLDGGYQVPKPFIHQADIDLVKKWIPSDHL